MIRSKLTILFASLLVLVVSESAAQTTERFHLSAGVALNQAKGLDAGIVGKLGGYFGAGTTVDFTDKFGVGGDLQYILQRLQGDDNEAMAHTMNVSFNYRYYPTDGLALLLGIQSGMVLQSTVETETGEKINQGIFGLQVGGSYALSNLEISAKYNHYISDSLFDSMIQLGVNFRLGN